MSRSQPSAAHATAQSGRSCCSRRTTALCWLRCMLRCRHAQTQACAPYMLRGTLTGMLGHKLAQMQDACSDAGSDSPLHAAPPSISARRLPRAPRSLAAQGSFADRRPRRACLPLDARSRLDACRSLGAYAGLHARLPLNALSLLDAR